MAPCRILGMKQVYSSATWAQTTSVLLYRRLGGVGMRYVTCIIAMHQPKAPDPTLTCILHALNASINSSECSQYYTVLHMTVIMLACDHMA